MAVKTLTTRVQQKNDTSANWAKATNFTPLKGEIIVYTDLNKIKIGDGVTKVGVLEFVSAKDAETLLGASLSTILNSSDVEIPTSKAVLDALEKYIDDMFGMSELSLRASDWTGTESPYSQVVEVSGVTANSKVDLNPTGEQLNSLATNRTILNTANDNGTVTVYAIGNKPTEDYTMQATITEV